MTCTNEGQIFGPRFALGADLKRLKIKFNLDGLRARILHPDADVDAARF